MVNPPRILLVDDHEVFSSAFSLVLAGHDEWVVLPPRLSARAVLEAPELDFDLLLTDLMMPGLDGFDLIRSLRSRPLPPKIIVLTSSENPGDLKQVLDAGVEGLVGKADSLDEVVEACRAVLRGDRWISTRLKDLLPRTGGLFTPAEEAVLTQLGAAKSLKQTAATLGISPKTAAIHRQHILKKLNLSDPNQLLQWLWKRGL